MWPNARSRPNAGAGTVWWIDVEVPETRYALTDDGVHIAYHVVGDGPVDILWMHSMNGPPNSGGDRIRVQEHPAVEGRSAGSVGS